ncbi:MULTISPECIES: GNAT family N-acetyltransferase [Haloferax]|uniref:GNAT family N-acetyltransferase n=2 Tax=Haloferax TaxID=2251 RepID=A0A6G1YZ09_9EURY|nr:MULTISPECIES: GNAT family N-acetyltransferase [Haloferax]KAB1187004.1 GNAT family N-acetyltransferase [Haloferax sp. CBA1149]MRW79637.1 GNAT family N-acetyltransferase [Haloferax marinisediminis]
MPIRAATEDDIEAIRRVAKRSWETDYPEILTRETIDAGVEDWYAHEQIADALLPARSLVLVAERDESVVGFAHATWSNDEHEGYILRLYVHPDHRRQGVGSELLERIRGDLSTEGVDRINAMVLAENEPGNTFYEQFGFEFVDEAKTTIGGDSYRENRYALE